MFGHLASTSLVLAALAVFFMAACVPSSPGSDGISAESYIPRDVATVAAACAASDFDPGKTRTRLIAAGFVEQFRPLSHQLEKFPVGAKPSSQGVVVPWKRPCRPEVDVRYVRASLAAAAAEFSAAGFETTTGSVYSRKSQIIRLQARGLNIGGPAEINLAPY